MKIRITFIICLLSLFISVFSQNWTETEKKVPEKSLSLALYSFYSQAMDIDGDYAVIGGANYATILFYNGSNWIKQAELSPSSSGNNFGMSVGISGDLVVVGSQGNAYVFEKPTTGWADATFSLNPIQGGKTQQKRLG